MNKVEEITVVWWAMASALGTSEGWKQVAEWAFGARQYALERAAFSDAEDLRFIAELASWRADAIRNRLQQPSPGRVAPARRFPSPRRAPSELARSSQQGSPGFDDHSGGESN